jgi:hypothetical protein
MLSDAFQFLPAIILIYYWIIPTIFFLVGIIVLLFGLILPEHRGRSVYYHRGEPEHGYRERETERREEPKYRYESRTTRTEPMESREHREHTKTYRSEPTTTGRFVERKEHVEHQERSAAEGTHRTTTTGEGRSEIIEEHHEEKRIKREE